MRNIGSVVLSFEEAGDLQGVIPWKVENPYQLFLNIKEQLPSLTGFIYLSTCNRVEIAYSLKVSGQHDRFLEILTSILPPLRKGVEPSHYRGRKAILHLLRLASGFESMVLGETEIRSQIKDAFEDALLKRMVDSRLRTLFQNIFQESKIIRNGIPINNLPLSVATLATQHLERYEPLEHKGTAVIIGSGPMSRQSAIYLAKDKRKLILVNRTIEKVQQLAEKLNAGLNTFDIFLNQTENLCPISAIITATSRGTYFIDKEFIKKIQFNNQKHGVSKNIVIVDMALPADADPAITELEGVRLISMETLREELEQNKSKREKAVIEAEGMLEDALFRIEVNLVSSMSGPILTMVQKRVKDRSRSHLRNLLEHRLSHLTQKDKRMIYTWAIQAHRDMNKVHRRGLECLLRHYYTENRKEEAVFGEHV